eukprot:1146630-Pelagomonas_calceolata.AAC.1
MPDSLNDSEACHMSEMGDVAMKDQKAKAECKNIFLAPTGLMITVVELHVLLHVREEGEDSSERASTVDEMMLTSAGDDVTLTGHDIMLISVGNMVMLRDHGMVHL